jgi:DnaJ domain
VTYRGADTMLDYYSILDIEPDASPGEVRRAYRRQAKRLHPDSSLSEDATREFQRLQDAYKALHCPKTRLAYDASRIATPQTGLTFPEFGGRPDTKPFRCGFCRKPTAQPRYAAYRTVISSLVFAHRRTKAGLFCSSCARKTALQASLTTALLGWWSLPGLVAAPQAIVRNGGGGERPSGMDERLLWLSAIRFYERGDARMAKGLATLAARKRLYSHLANNMVLCLSYLAPRERGTVRDAWDGVRLDKWKHWALALVVPALVANAMIYSNIPVAPAVSSVLDAGHDFAYRLLAAAKTIRFF